MLTYQDLEGVNHENEAVLMGFIRSAITNHQSSPVYKVAVTANEYMKKRNKTILEFQKMIYTVTGRAVPDTYSTNYKIGRAFFPFFITQENQYLLSNGCTWENDDTADKLGTKKKPFDRMLMKAGKEALVGGVSFGFFNLDHVDVFTIREFVPFYDENNGSLRAGVRFWQLDPKKPLRATLYEEDGYTEYIWNKRKDPKTGTETEEGKVYVPKRAYKITATKTDVDDEVIYEGENYPGFPIIPFYGNEEKQSEIIGIQEQIDTYDLIKSGFCDNVEEASYVFWAIHNAGGMDDYDLAKFVERARTIHAAVTESSGAEATAQTIETPTAARETLLDRIEKDIFKDAMAFDPEKVIGGGATATQIRASYEALSSKTDGYEYCVLDFINGILDIAGIDDNATFTRSQIVNVNESVNTILAAAEYLSEDYVTTKILTIFGDGDQAEDILEEMSADELERGDMLDYEEEEEFDEFEEEPEEEYEEGEELLEEEEPEEVEETEETDTSDLEGIIEMLEKLLKEL